MSIKEIYNKAIIENTLCPRNFARAYISLKNTRTDNIENNLAKNEDLRLTNWVYFVKYKPERKVKPYMVNADVMVPNEGHLRRYRSYEEFEKMGQIDEGIKWIIENTNVSKEMFEIAKENPYMNIPISIDIVKYTERIGSKKLMNDAMREILETTIKVKKERDYAPKRI